MQALATIRPIRLFCCVVLAGGGAFAQNYGQPAIYYRGVVNSASFMAPGLPGGSVAQGSTFSIFGQNLGPSSSPPLSFPLGTSLGGVTVTVTQGKTTLNCYPVFVSPGLINAILPSNTPLGMVSLQVGYSNVKSNLAPVKVVASSFGIFTANSAGSGPAIVQNFVSATSQPTNGLQVPAQHGQTAILWGTGLGAVNFPDNVAPTVTTLSVGTQVLVGGQPATVAYAGRTPCCAGIDEIIFTVPASAPSGCWVPVIVQTMGASVSNVGTMAISDSGNCAEPANALTQALIGGGNIASFLAARISAHEDVGVLQAGDVTADLLGGFVAAENQGNFNFNPMFSLPPAGSCTGYTVAGWFPDDVSLLPGMLPTGGFLDAGSPTLSGANGKPTTITPANLGGMIGAYLGGALSAVPSTANSAYLNPGNFMLAGAGGKNVGSFQVSATVPTPLNWTNRDQLVKIPRSQPLTVNWSGASANSTVFIAGGAADLPSNSTALFLCVAPSGASSFTVPPIMMANIPATRSRVLQSPAALYVGEWNFGNPATFQATGINYGLFTTAVVSARTVIFQ